MRVGMARAGVILAVFSIAAVVLLPVQWVLVRLGSRFARRLPHVFHKGTCRLLGVRIAVHGELPHDRGALLVANHVSWLDIPVLSAVAPVSFVAKAEVAGWGLVGTLARMQRTEFVDRTRRTAAAPAVMSIARRLGDRDTIVLFAEGTSSGGERVLPLRSSLLAGALANGGGTGGSATSVRPVAIVYRALNGLPIGRIERPQIGFYGDMDMRRHAWALLEAGPVDVEVHIGPELGGDGAMDRKALAAACEQWIGDTLVAAVRGLQQATPGLAAGRPAPRGPAPGLKEGPGGWR